MSNRLHRLLAPALLCLAPAAVPAQAVITLDDDGPPADASFMQEALAKAGPGDVILIREGEYDLHWGILIDRPLTLVAELGADVRLDGHVTISGLLTGEAVVLRGLTLFADEWQDAGLVIRDNAGMAFVEDCVLEGDGYDSVPAVWIEDSASAVFTDCTIEGGWSGGVGSGGVGPVAIRSIDSQVALYDSEIIGGHSSKGMGNNGVRIDSGSLFAQGCQITGGASGGAILTPWGWVGPPGGTALFLGGGNPEVDLTDTLVEAGSSLALGGAGEPIVIQSGTVTEHPGTAVRLHAPTSVAPYSPGLLTVEAAPHALVWLFVSLSMEPSMLPPVDQPWWLASPQVVWTLGVADAQGHIAAPYHAPYLLPGMEVLGLSAQAASLSGSDIVLGDPTRFLVLSP